VKRSNTVTLHVLLLRLNTYYTVICRIPIVSKVLLPFYEGSRLLLTNHPSGTNKSKLSPLVVQIQKTKFKRLGLLCTCRSIQSESGIYLEQQHLDTVNLRTDHLHWTSKPPHRPWLCDRLTVLTSKIPTPTHATHQQAITQSCSSSCSRVPLLPTRRTYLMHTTVTTIID